MIELGHGIYKYYSCNTDCKMKVDGISKYLDNASFEFDHTFHEENSTEDI